MKKRHGVESNIKKFHKMVKTGLVVFDSPIQRDYGQWTNKQKSKLIRAILTDFSIPPIYSVGYQDETKKEMVYSVLDGKQRLSSITDYIDNSFALGDIPEVEYEGETYKLKGKRFEELPEELQDAIYDYSLSMVYYVFLTEDELAEMFDLLNSGTPLSRQQKANARMGMSSAAKMNELKTHPFMTVNASLGRNQHVKALDSEVLTQAMMLIDSQYELMSFSGKNMNAYSDMLKEGKDYIFEEMAEILDYVHLSLDTYTDKLVLKKSVIPIVLYIGKIAKEQNLKNELFLEWINEFKLSIENRGKIKIDYSDYMGAGSGSSRNKVQGRIKAATRHFEKFCRNQNIPVTV